MNTEIDLVHDGHQIKLEKYRCTCGMTYWSIVPPKSEPRVGPFPSKEQAMEVASTFYSWGLAEPQ